MEDELQDKERVVLPLGLIDGIRELLEDGMTPKQVLAVVKIAGGVARIGGKLKSGLLAKRCRDIIETIRSDLELKRIHGR